MDWPTYTAALAARLGTVTAGSASIATATDVLPDAPFSFPFLLVRDPVLDYVQSWGGWVRGTATFEVICLLDGRGDVPGRQAAVRAWASALPYGVLVHSRLGIASPTRGEARVTRCEPEIELDGGSGIEFAGEVYDGVRLTVECDFEEAHPEMAV